MVIRQPKAYPVYDEGYQDRVEIIRRWLEGFENIQAAGRNAMHRYNNQDRSMLSAMAAIRRLLDPMSGVDSWEVKVERLYQEEFRVRPRPAVAVRRPADPRPPGRLRGVPTVGRWVASD